MGREAPIFKSAHQNVTARFAQPFDHLAFIGKVRLVHGELEQADVLAKSLVAKGFKDVVIPDRGESVRLS